MVDEHAFVECVFMQVYNALSGMKISSLDKPVQVREKARSKGIVKGKLLYSFIHFKSFQTHTTLFCLWKTTADSFQA